MSFFGIKEHPISIGYELTMHNEAMFNQKNRVSNWVLKRYDEEKTAANKSSVIVVGLTLVCDH